MKLKISLFLTVLLIFICCIGAASAAEDITDDVISTDSDLGVIEQTDDASLEVNNNEDIIRSGTTPSVSTWDDLKNYSMKTDADYEITVADGTYNVGSDQVVFGNNAKIIGSGNTVITGGDASVTTFTGTGKSITFSNLIFRNMNSNMVIHLIDSGSSKIENCVFENIVTSTSGQKSVVYNNGGYMKITNSNFTNCNTTYGVITNHKTPTTALMDVENCRFVNNRASVEPGAINNCGIMNVTDSVFNYNRAAWWAGAFHTHTNAKSVIKRCSFTGNTAGWNGGALYAYANLEVYDSNFTDNNCSTNNGGGAIGASNYFFASTAYNVKVNNCRFVDNNNLHANGYGGAIAAMNGGTLNVNGSTFIHNSARYGQAIAGFNTNEYSNISHGNAKLVITNNQFINHTVYTYDTVLISGNYYTFKGNTFTNSPQSVHYTGSNTYNSVISPVSTESKSELLGSAQNDILSSDKTGKWYVNASLELDDPDGMSWNSAVSDLGNSLGGAIFMNSDAFEGGYTEYVYIADGEYSIEYTDQDMFCTYNFIGYGDNVIINDVKIRSEQDKSFMDENNYLTFTNIIFKGFSYIDDYNCTFINCTFLNPIEFSQDRDNYVYVPRDANGGSGDPIYVSAPVFNVTLSNCKFIGVNGDYVINANRYVNLVITDSNFTNCAVDSIIVTKSNSSAEKALYTVDISKFYNDDGINVSNINVAGSTFKGVLKAQDDTIYSVEKVSGITPTADIIKDGKNIYLNATDVKAEEPINNGTSTNSTDNASSTNTGKTNTNTNKQTTTKKVTKKATKITAKKATFKAKKKTKKYTIVLKAGKSAVKKVKVTIKIGKKTFKATTNNKGKATFKITKLTKKGKYIATIKFAGNKNFKATSKKVKITVKK